MCVLRSVSFQFGVEILLDEDSPFDSTKRSRLKKFGFSGAYFIAYFHSATPIAAIPMAPPGCPPLNCWHRSAMRHLNVFRTRPSSSASFKSRLRRLSEAAPFWATFSGRFETL
jgi:hypothetical protein